MQGLAFKTVGIIGAMDVEVEFLTSKISDCQGYSFGILNFFAGKLFGLNVVIIKSGVGKVNAAICAQQLIDKFDCDCILNVGIAGAIAGNVNVGDIVLAEKAQYHDFDATAAGYEIGGIPNMPTSQFFADKNLIAAFEKAAQNCNGTYHVGTIASGDTFVANDEQKEQIYKNTSALCVEMEGAAIAHTCSANNVPFAIVRSISDGANDEAPLTYEENEKGASDKASEIVYEGLKLISEF